MSITVTTPIVSKPPKTRHAGGNSGGHAHSVAKPHLPKVPHVRAPQTPRAPKAPHAAKVPHARAPRAVHAPRGITTAEAAQGTIDNNQLAAALDGGYFGTGATLPAGATPYTGPFNAQGLPDPHAPGTIKIKNIPHGPAPHVAGAAHRSSRTSSGHAPAAHKPPVTHPRKITAPLQLSDSGLLGHDSHVSGPPALVALAPIVRRRPH